MFGATNVAFVKSARDTSVSVPELSATTRFLAQGNGCEWNAVAVNQADTLCAAKTKVCSSVQPSDPLRRVEGAKGVSVLWQEKLLLLNDRGFMRHHPPPKSYPTLGIVEAAAGDGTIDRQTQ